MSYLNLLCQGYTIDEVINLDEARKRLAITDVDWKKGKSVKGIEQNSTFSRRENAFSDMYRGMLPNPRSRFGSAFEEPFGNFKFQSPKRELLLKSILPQLAYYTKSYRSHYEPDGSWTTNDVMIPNNLKRQLVKELKRHIHSEAIHIDRHVTRVHKKLSPEILRFRQENPKVGYNLFLKAGQNESPLELASHDAFDHGYTGALPSEYGEIVAGHFASRTKRLKVLPSKVISKDGNLKNIKLELHDLFNGMAHEIGRRYKKVHPPEKLLELSRSL